MQSSQYSPCDGIDPWNSSYPSPLKCCSSKIKDMSFMSILEGIGKGTRRSHWFDARPVEPYIFVLNDENYIFWFNTILTDHRTSQSSFGVDQLFYLANLFIYKWKVEIFATVVHSALVWQWYPNVTVVQLHNSGKLMWQWCTYAAVVHLRDSIFKHNVCISSHNSMYPEDTAVGWPFRQGGRSGDISRRSEYWRTRVFVD